MIIWRQTTFTECVGRYIRIVGSLSKLNTTLVLSLNIGTSCFHHDCMYGEGGGVQQALYTGCSQYASGTRSLASALRMDRHVHHGPTEYLGGDIHVEQSNSIYM